MGEVAIRVPSVDGLFDEWSAAPLEERFLNDDARERILDAWHNGKIKRKSPDQLLLILPSDARKEGLEQTILAAFRHDMEQTCIDARRHWIRRSLSARETRIGFLVFFVAMVISVLISDGSDGSSVETLLAQTFVVIAWVALWGPAGRFIRGASYRLERGTFADLAKVPVEIRWE
ncbi:MAG: hypothetical protein ACSLFI_07310 [Solirubrobacterales bacterium]